MKRLNRQCPRHQTRRRKYDWVPRAGTVLEYAAVSGIGGAVGVVGGTGEGGIAAMVTRGAGVVEAGAAAGVEVVAAAFLARVRCPFSARSLSLLASEHTNTPSLLTLYLTLSIVTSVLPLVVLKALGVEVGVALLEVVFFFFLAARNFSRFFLILS